MSGSLKLLSPNNGQIYGALLYDISVKDDIVKALALQKVKVAIFGKLLSENYTEAIDFQNRLAASTLLSLKNDGNAEKNNSTLNPQLVVQIHRCNKLSTLTKGYS